MFLQPARIAPSRRSRFAIRRRAQGYGPASADIMVPDGEKIRHLSVVNQPFDQRIETHVPLVAVLAGDDRISGLHDEPHGKSRPLLVGNRGEDAIDDVSMGGLNRHAVGRTSRVAVGNEGKFRLVAGVGFGRQSNAARIDRLGLSRSTSGRSVLSPIWKSAIANSAKTTRDAATHGGHCIGYSTDGLKPSAVASVAGRRGS